MEYGVGYTIHVSIAKDLPNSQPLSASL